MKRRLFWCVTAFLIGVYMAHFMPDCISIPLCAGLLFVLFIALFFTKRAVFPFCMVLLFVMGAFRMQAALRETERPLFPYLNEYVTIQANCIREPEPKEGYSVVYAELTEVAFLDKVVPMQEKVRLTVGKTEPLPQFGESFSAVCLFSLPEEAMNQGDFDYQLYLKSQEIFFTGAVEAETLRITGAFTLDLGEKLYRFNQYCNRLLEHYLSGDSAAVLRAMALGDTSGLSDDFYEKLKVSGLSHVTSVSGMHVSTLVSLLYVLFSLLGQNRYKYIWLTAGVILFFMLFTGASPSVVRASVMGVMTLLAYLLYRQEDRLTSLAVAAAVIVMLNPASAVHMGFMLSFAASLGLLLFARPLCRSFMRPMHRLKQKKIFYKACQALSASLSATVSTQIFILPLSAYLFGTFSLHAFVTNLIVSVLAPFLLGGGLSTVFLGLLHPKLSLLSAGFTYPFLSLFLWLVNAFGAKPEGLLTVGRFSFFKLYVYALAVFAFERALRKKWRQFTAVFVSIVLLCASGFVYSHIKEERAELTFINVGHADCSLLRLPENITVLIDGGGQPDYAGDYDIGTEIVLPYLKKKGITELDYMIATHPHEDHIEGLYSLLGQIETKNLVVPIGFCDLPLGADLVEKAKNCDAEVIEVSFGETIEFSEGSFLEVLLPDADWLSESPTENDACLVMRFTFGGVRVLFTGDIEAAEDYLCRARPELLQADILKVAHHGSDSSSRAAFLEKVSPRYAYIPCGKNSFGHPAQSVLDRLFTAGACVYRADLDKDVTFTMSRTEVLHIRKGAGS